MQCNDFESVLASEGLSALSAEARKHLGGCSRCQDFLADFDSIVALAKTLPAEVTPPDRVWVALRAQLEAEGLIKETPETAARSSWWENLSFLWKPRSLASAGAALVLAAAAAFLAHPPLNTNTNVAIESPGPKATGTAEPAAPGSVTPDSPSASVPATASARNSTPGPAPSKVKELKPSPSENASSMLSETEVDVSNMRLAGNGNAQVDVSLRENLRTLNEFIAECEKHLRKNPQDELAREYLNIAYQQKADLLAAMLESGRSEH